MDEYLSIDFPTEIVYEINKSRFITNLFPTTDEKMAIDYINMIRKKYFDARHHCSAIQIGDKYQKFDDDGEPQGTAGKPMLEVLKKKQLLDVTVIVTRYFGGIKLGANGLVRAYTKSVQLAIEKAKIIKKTLAKEVMISFDYNLLGLIEHYLHQNDILIKDKNYDLKVSFIIVVLKSEYENLNKKIVEMTANCCVFQVLSELYLNLPIT